MGIKAVTDATTRAGAAPESVLREWIEASL
jgi:hypothetical protein